VTFGGGFINVDHVQYGQMAPIPEPESWALMADGLAGLAPGTPPRSCKQVSLTAALPAASLRFRPAAMPAQAVPARPCAGGPPDSTGLNADWL